MVALQMILFLYLVTVGWQLRSLMLPPGDPEIMVRTRTVSANAFWLGANAVALAFYLLRPRRIGRYVLLAILAFDVVNSLFAALGFILSDDSATGVEWLVAAIVPLLAIRLVWHQPSEGSSARLT